MASPNEDIVPLVSSMDADTPVVDVAASNVVATGSVAGSVDREAKKPGSVTASIDPDPNPNAKKPESRVGSVDGEAEAFGSVEAAVDKANDPQSVAASTNNAKEPQSVAASTNNAKEPQTVAASADNAKEPQSVAASADNAKGHESVPTSEDSAKASGSVEASVDGAKASGSAPVSADKAKGPGNVAALADDAKGPVSTAGSADGELKAPGSVAKLEDSTKEPESIAASAGNAKGPASVANSVHDVIAHARIAVSLDQVSKPLGSATTPVHDGTKVPEISPDTTVVVPPEQHPVSDQGTPQRQDAAIAARENAHAEQHQNQVAMKLSTHERRAEEAGEGPSVNPIKERPDAASTPSALPPPAVETSTKATSSKPPLAPRLPIANADVRLPPAPTICPSGGTEDPNCAVVIASDLPPGFFDACCAASAESGALLVWRHNETCDLSDGETSTASSSLWWPRNSRARKLAHIKDINLQPMDILARLASGDLEECASLFSSHPCISEVEHVCQEQLPQCAVFTNTQQQLQGIKTVDLGPFVEKLCARRGVIVSDQRNWAHALGAEYVPLFANAQGVGDDFTYRGNNAKEFQRWLRYILVIKA